MVPEPETAAPPRGSAPANMRERTVGGRRPMALWKRAALATLAFWVLVPAVFSFRGEVRAFFRSVAKALDLGQPGQQLALVLALVVLILPAVLAPIYVYHRLTFRNRPRDGYTRCGMCGYILKGLQEPRCPECGERI